MRPECARCGWHEVYGELMVFLKMDRMRSILWKLPWNIGLLLGRLVIYLCIWNCTKAQGLLASQPSRGFRFPVSVFRPIWPLTILEMTVADNCMPAR